MVVKNDEIEPIGHPIFNVYVMSGVILVLIGAGLMIGMPVISGWFTMGLIALSFGSRLILDMHCFSERTVRLFFVVCVFGILAAVISAYPNEMSSSEIKIAIGFAVLLLSAAMYLWIKRLIIHLCRDD